MKPNLLTCRSLRWTLAIVLAGLSSVLSSSASSAQESHTFADSSSHRVTQAIPVGIAQKLKSELSEQEEPSSPAPAPAAPAFPNQAQPQPDPAIGQSPIPGDQVPRLQSWPRSATTSQFLVQATPDGSPPSETPPEAPVADPTALPDDLPEEEDTDITVTGTRTPRPVRLSPANITVFDFDDIDEILVRDLRDLFRYEPNVTVGNNRRYGLQDINIRGLGENRVLIQNDGIRVPTFFTFGTPSYGRDYVDLEVLGRAEIIRGPASALYGSDALGGVVSFQTLQPRDLFERYGTLNLSSLSTNFDSADRGWVHTGLTASRIGPVDFLLSFTRRDSFEASVPVSNNLVDPRVSDRNNFLGKLVYNFSEFSNLTFTGEYFDNSDRFQINSNLVGDLLGPAGFRGQGEDLNADTSRTRFSLAYQFGNEDNPGLFQAARVQIYYQDSQIEENRFQDFVRVGAGADQRRVRNLSNRFTDRVFGGDVQFQSNFQGGNVRHRLVYGLDLSTTRNERVRDGVETRFDAAGNAIQIGTRVGPDNFPVKDFPDSNTVRFGLYVQNEIEFGETVTIIPGLRFDTYNLNTSPDEIYARNVGAQASDFSASALSPSLGLVVRVTPELALVGRYARGFRAPLFSEINSGFSNLAGPGFRYRTLSNPDLEAETSNNFELGIRGRYSQVRFSLTGFYNTYNNFIETFASAGTDTTIVPPFPVFLFQTQNVSRARIYGFEMSGQYQFSPGDSGFSLLASLGLTVGDDLTAGQPLESVNPFRAVVGLRYRAPENRWGADLITSLVGEPRLRDDRPANSFTPGSYTVVDLIGFYNITPLVTLNMGIFNLFNTQYFEYQDVRTLVNGPAPSDINRFAQPGISFRAGLTWRF